MTQEVKLRREATERKYRAMKRNQPKPKREEKPKAKFGMSSEQMKKLIEERRQREENANPTQVCKNCVDYPCFRGIDTMSSNLALTCPKWRMKS